jgi:hypothetical protein
MTQFSSTGDNIILVAIDVAKKRNDVLIQFPDGSRKRMRMANRMAEQGEWPARAPVGYRGNPETKIIEPDPVKAPFIKKLFEWYASGQYSLDRLSRLAMKSGLFSRNSVTINKAGIHRILNNTIYFGEFTWKGKRYIGKYTPIISKALYDEAQEVFAQANHPKETKREFAFAGLLNCGKYGCAMTPEIKKGNIFIIIAPNSRVNAIMYISERKGLRNYSPMWLDA